MPAARNTFAEQAGAYARARPAYPADLFDWLARACARADRAWDCATGNGQAALGLAGRFRAVHATDVSAAQLAHARRGPRVHYAAAAAEQPPFAPGSFDLVIAAQALHWFDFARFWRAVAAVARPGALFCAWGYDRAEVNLPVVEQEVLRPLRAAVARFWSPRNRIMWDGYPDEEVHFPWPRLQVPPFFLEVRWTMQQLLGYVATWSACVRCREDARAAAEVARITTSAATLLPPGTEFTLRWPLRMLAGHIQR